MKPFRSLEHSGMQRKSRIRQCLILAAGNGSRLRPLSHGVPKPLMQVHGRPLVEHVIRDAHQAGIDRFVIVVGYGADAMREWFTSCSLEGVSITLVENSEYHKNNGVSVLKASSYFSSPFLLLMSDHIFEPSTARMLLNQPLMKGEVILAVDSKLDSIFDLDDVTKVRRLGDHIIAIGKELGEYDGYDTGMFLCSPELFDALELAKIDGNCSLSDAMRLLGRRGMLRAFDIGDASWQDVDTPEALAYTESIFDAQFCRQAAPEAYFYA
ncbi:MAG: phosphocholine cytidylyltransferase family protein [Acidobacteriaceae bacterium]|nr:phosphocholine cytidylyltransferase family protein [Acidobacteriaceae bacterium]